MRSVLAVVANIFAHQPFQVPFIEYDDMIEQIFSTAANPAFGDAVLPWASEAGPFGLDAETLRGIDHFQIEVCSTIKDQVAGYRVVGKGLAQLL